MEASLVMRIMANSVKVANSASQIVRNLLLSNADLKVKDKGVNDLQTRADRDAQRCIVGSLQANFPGLEVIGEEGVLDQGDIPTVTDLCPEVLSHPCPQKYASAQLDDLVVWVDPLDATKEFTELPSRPHPHQGFIDHVTVLIGLAYRGHPIGGVIAQPFYYQSSGQASPSHETRAASSSSIRLIWALDQVGCFGPLTKRPLIDSLPYPLRPEAVKGSIEHCVVVTRSHPTDTLQAAIDSVAPTKVLRVGGCGYKVLAVIEGHAHVYLFPSRGTKKWDTCAPEAVLNALGGGLVDLHGRPYSYVSNQPHPNLHGIIAAPVASWLPVYTRLMPKVVLDSL